jgi:hypothetical protein
MMQEQDRGNDHFYTESPEEDVAKRLWRRDGHAWNSQKQTTRNCEMISVYAKVVVRYNLLYPLFREISFHVFLGKSARW